MSQSQDLLESVQPYVQNVIQRARTLPIFTFGITAAMALFFLLTIFTSIISSFSLKPSDVPNFELSRLTTYPLIHVSFLQLVLSLGLFIPLSSRFERKFGTLRSLAMFLGPFESVPGLLYCLVNGVILRRDSAVTGCSGFVFTLFSIEALTYSSTKGKEVVFAGRKIPVYLAPLFGLLLATLFLPNTSILLHCTAIGMGFVFGSGLVDFLLLPLKVVNFVEKRVNIIFSKIPNYITAEQAGAGQSILPIQEPRGQDESSVISSDDDQGIHLQQTQSSVATISTQHSINSQNLAPGSARPAIVRQSSSKWTTSERED